MYGQGHCNDLAAIYEKCGINYGTTVTGPASTQNAVKKKKKQHISNVSNHIPSAGNLGLGLLLQGFERFCFWDGRW